MADPLSFLRNYNVNKKEIIERDNQIIFGEYSWTKYFNINFLMWGPKKKNRIIKEYTLECLVFFLKNIHLIHPVYYIQAKDANIQAVRYPDREELLAYLNRETITCASIDKSALLEITQVKKTHDHVGGESVVNKPRIEETHVQKVREQLASVAVDNINEENKINRKASGSYYEVILMDPLSLLRHYNVKKKEIIERDNRIICGEFSWPKNVNTNYLLRRSSGKKSSVKEYYTMECLLYFLKNSHLIHQVYCKQAAGANIQTVRRRDRKKLLVYLNSEITTNARIDKSAPLQIPTQVKRTHDHEVADSVAKKPRIEETQS